MRFINALVLSTTLWCASVSHASDVKMKSLQDILTEETSLATISTMLVRCMALYDLGGEYLLEQKGQEIKDMGKDFKKNSGDLQLLYTYIMKSTTDYQDKDITEHFKAHYALVKDIYFDKMLRGKALAGNIFEDKLVSNDFKVCAQGKNIALQEIQKYLK